MKGKGLTHPQAPHMPHSHQSHHAPCAPCPTATQINPKTGKDSQTGASSTQALKTWNAAWGKLAVNTTFTRGYYIHILPGTFTEATGVYGVGWGGVGMCGVGWGVEEGGTGGGGTQHFACIRVE